MKTRLALAALFLAHTLITLHEIGSRFLVGHHGWNASMRSIIAKNYVTHGLLETKFLPYKTIWTTAAPDGPIHWNHPPAINLMTAASFGIFGEHEWAARLPVVLASLGLFFAFWFYGRTLSATDERRVLLGLTTVAVFVFTPIQMLFGNMVNYEPPILLCAMLGWVAFQHQRNALGILAFVAAVFIDWSACFVAAGAGFALLLQRKPKAFLGLGAATTAMFLSLFAWLHLNATGKGLFGLGDRRASGVTYEKLFDLLAARIEVLYGWPLILLAALGLVVQLVRLRPDPVVVTFLVGPLAYFLTFKQAAVVHNFYLLLTMPAFVVSAAIGIRLLIELTDWIDPRLPAVAALVLCAGVVWNAHDSWPEQHLRRYSIESGAKPPKFPRMGRLHEIEVFRWVNQHSEPDDGVALHSGIRPSIQARYYLWRPYKMRYPRVAKPKNDEYRFLIMARRHLKTPDKMRKDAQILWAGDYVVLDFENAGKPDIRLAYREIEAPWWHHHFVSSLYPAFETDTLPYGKKR